MERSDRRAFWLGVGIAFLTPLAVAGLIAILVARTGPQKVSLIGLPEDHLQGLAVASASEAKVSEEQAIEVARGGTRGTSTGRVLDIALGRYRGEPLHIYSGRLAWVVSLEPDKRAPVFISGGVGVDHSCDWAAHYEWVDAVVDAESGELLSSGSGASFDLSLPPTYVRPDNSDRAYCERLSGQQ